MKQTILSIAVGLISLVIMYVFITSDPAIYVTGAFHNKFITGVCLGIFLAVSNYFVYAEKNQVNYARWFLASVILMVLCVLLNLI